MGYLWSISPELLLFSSGRNDVSYPDRTFGMFNFSNRVGRKQFKMIFATEESTYRQKREALLGEYSFLKNSVKGF